MKKIVSLLLILVILTAALCSCNDSKPIGSLELIDEINHEKVAEKLLSGSIDVAILPEPKATAAILQAAQAGHNYSIKLNLSEEWDAVSDTGLAMGCIVVKNDFSKNHEASLAKFLDEYEKSIEYIGNSKNHAQAAQMIVDAGILPKLPIAKAALTNLYGSIVYQDGKDMKKSLEAFYSAIDMDMPEDSFYYSQTSSPKGSDTDTIKIAVMTGPTGMGMAKLMKDGGANYKFEAFSDPQLAVAALNKGEVDMACLPTNTAASLANAGQQISVAAINCLGSLYVVVKDGIEVESIEDLVDKKVYYGVPNSTTAPIFKYILAKNKIEISGE